jgi:plasmid stabilization system protein ParE
MSLPVEFRPEAEVDLVSACDWYEGQQAGLSGAFLLGIEDALNRIKSMPQMYASVLPGTRRAKVQKFPYLIYYRILPRCIEVIGLLHSSRDPKLWQRRVN